MSEDFGQPSFAVFLRLVGRLCAVVGGGEVAARKVRSLLDSGARVRLIAPDVCPELRTLEQAGRIKCVSRAYEPGDLVGSVLAFGATDDAGTNQAVYEEAQQLGIPVNVVDKPQLCTFYVPAVAVRGPIQIAISTGGASPALARRLKELTMDAIGEEYGRLAELLGSLRAETKARLGSAREREAAWRRALDSEALFLLKLGRVAEARKAARQALGLDEHDDPPQTNNRVIRLGTRGSPLALAQAHAVADRLREMDLSVEIVTIRTSGDRGAEIGAGSSTGVFVREIEQALLREEVDLAVHSMKDLPTGDRPGLVVAAVPAREDPHDALISRGGKSLRELPLGGKVGTASPRRVAQLRAVRPDLTFVPVRGNIGTRLQKLEQGKFDAIVLACAGLARLNLSHVVVERLPHEVCLPAPGQGALALQVRERDGQLRELLAALDDAATRSAVEAERAFLAAVEGGCATPVGALGTVTGGQLRLAGVIAEETCGLLLRGEVSGPSGSARDLGAALAARIRAAAADEMGVSK